MAVCNVCSICNLDYNMKYEYLPKCIHCERRFCFSEYQQSSCFYDHKCKSTDINIYKDVNNKPCSICNMNGRFRSQCNMCSDVPICGDIGCYTEHYKTHSLSDSLSDSDDDSKTTENDGIDPKRGPYVHLRKQCDTCYIWYTNERRCSCGNRRMDWDSDDDEPVAW